jgi:hypothetical protein
MTLQERSETLASLYQLQGQAHAMQVRTWPNPPGVHGAKVQAVLDAINDAIAGLEVVADLPCPPEMQFPAPKR